MPTDPRGSRRAGDDAYVVDTRGRPKRPGGGSIRSSRGADVVDPPRPAATPAPRGTRTGYAGQGGPQGGGQGGQGGQSGQGGGGGGRPPAPRGGPAAPVGEPTYRWRKGRIAALVAGLLVIAWLAFMIWVPISAWNSVTRVDNIPSGERPADTAGYNYLLVGSDSRDGLTPEQRKKYATGTAAGSRTDTIMIVHVSESGG